MAHDRSKQPELGIPAIDRQPVSEGATPDAVRGVSEAELEDVMNDPGLSLEERRARLQNLVDRLPARNTVDHAEAFAPMESRIGDALAMLAEGGHSYGMAAPMGSDDEDDAPGVSASPGNKPLR